MKISSFKIIIITSILTIIGFFIVPKLALKLNPSNTLPSITINYNLNNASAYILERDVTSILEGSFSTIRGLDKLDSRSSKRGGSITLFFNKHADIDIARFETATIIRQLYKKLPKETTYPTISVNRSDDTETSTFLSYNINAPISPFKIQEFVKTQIDPIIGSIPGVDKTIVYGAQPIEYILTYNQLQLNSLEIKKQDVIQAIRKKYARIALGDIFYNEQFITLSIQPSQNDLSWEIPIKKIGERIIYLKDLLSIKKQEQEILNYYRINGENTIILNVYAITTANTIVLSEIIEEQINAIKKTLPPSYSIIKAYDSTSYLKSELSKIYERSIYTIAILLLFIFLISHNIRYLLIIVLCIIVNINIAFLLYYIFKVEIQLYSLAGITISLGLVIDNSIVMIDHLKKQKNKTVFISILASTLTTIGALSIIIFLDDTYKVNLIDFAKVIIINLGVSLLVAFYLIPTLLQKIKLKDKTPKKWSIAFTTKFYNSYESILKILLRYKRLIIFIIILVFGIPLFMLPQKIENNDTWYAKTYNSTIGNNWYRENARPHIDRYLGGSIKLFSEYVFENAYYNRNEETKLYVIASMEKGATIQQMNEVFISLENYLHQFTEIKQYTSTIDGPNYARIEITFKDALSNNTSFPYSLKSNLVSKVLEFGGVDWNIYGVGKGFSNEEGYNVPVNFSVTGKGYNYDQLNIWADSLKVALETHPRIQKVRIRDNSNWAREPSFEYRFSLNKEQIALHKLSPQQVVIQLKNQTLNKQQDIALTIEGKNTPIRLESSTSKNFDLWSIQNTPLDSLQNPIYLKDLISIHKEEEEEIIYKENQEYIRKIEFQYTGSSKIGSKFLKSTLENFSSKLPLGFNFEQSSELQLLNKNKESIQYAWLLLLIFGIIYCICSILFESFTQPFIILSIIPISFIGIFLVFYIFDYNFDQGGLASFVLLSGITVNASIFILNDFNTLKKKFPETKTLSLYISAFRQKIFPILLTIASTILGFIPFIKDGQNEVFWFALGIGTIGGLIFSMVGILIYLPIFTIKKRV